MRDQARTLLSGTRGFLIVAGIPLALLFGFYVWGVVRGADDKPPAGADVAPPVVQLLRNPQEFLGQEVRVRGRLGEVLRGGAYTILPQRQGDFKPILVIQDEPFPSIEALRSELRPGRLVDVVGPYQRYDAGKFEQELGAELATALAQRFGERPAILAWSTTIVPTGQQPLEPQPPDVRQVSISDLAGETERYTGRFLSIRGTVTRVLGPRLFVVEDRVLVVDPIPGTPEGRPVIVEGYVRTLPPSELADEASIEIGPQTLVRLRGMPSMPAIVAYHVLTPGYEIDAGLDRRRFPPDILPPADAEGQARGE